MRLLLLAPDPPATAALGRALGAALLPLPPGGIVVVLDGELGAGKTVFAGGLVHGLGVPDTVDVPSPTFAFARAYRAQVPVVHIDAYRVTSPADLEASGYFELVENPRGEATVTVVEWGSRIADALPPDRLEVTLHAVPPPLIGTSAASARSSPEESAFEGSPLRRIEIEGRGPAAARILGRFGHDPTVLARFAAEHGPDASRRRAP